MKAMNMVDVKDFMKKLLIGEAFDSFLLTEASITTFNTFHIDGNLYRDFYDEVQQVALQEKEQNFSSWIEVKPFCFSIIKGKRTPLHFKIVFQLARLDYPLFLEDSGLPLHPSDIFGLYLNIQYDGTGITCTTGISQKTFSLDKALDNSWDIWIMRFFKENGIPTELL